jgi:tetratricopeptide (TPR) repeat protein
LHNLFKDLAQLIEKPNEDGSSRSIINIKGVLGIFVKNCCHEFQKLTFSQVTALHRQWKEFIDNSTDSHVINIKKLSEKEKLSKAKKERDFTLSLNLLLYSDGNSNVSVELKALHLAMLQAHFDHIEESSQSLQEAIRLAHLSQHEVVLEHALALLKRVQPTSLDVGRTLMKQFIKNARYQHKDLLISTGKLQLLHLDILCGQEPKHVLSSVMSSQFHVFNSIDDESTHKIAIRSSSLLLHGTALSQYNLNPLSDMVLQLLCHMISEGSNYNVHSISDLSKAIKLFAKSLHEKGHLTLGIKLLESAIKRLSIYDTTGRVIQPLKCGLAELLVEEGLQANDWAKVERNVTRMMTHNKVLGSYWKANLLYHKCQYSLAIDEANLLLTKLKAKEPTIDIYVSLVKVYLLKADVCYCKEQYGLAIGELMSALVLCEKYHLIFYRIVCQVKVIQCQLGLRMIDQCNHLMAEVIPCVMRNGNSALKAEVYLLQARVAVLGSFQLHNTILPQDRNRALKLLEYALKETGARSPLLKGHITVLQDALHNQ